MNLTQVILVSHEAGNPRSLVWDNLWLESGWNSAVQKTSHSVSLPEPIPLTSKHDSTLEDSKQTNVEARPETTCDVFTIYRTITVTDAPGTVTILQQDPSSVAASMASVDTLQVRQSSELAPTGNIPDTSNPVFTHSVRVSGFEATELPNDGTSVFYRPKSDGQTDPSHITRATIVAGITTVTVGPPPPLTTVHRGLSNDSTSDIHTTTITLSPLPALTASSFYQEPRRPENITAHAPFTSPPEGWNLTGTDATTLDPVSTQHDSTSSAGPMITTVTATSVQVVTVTQPATSTITDGDIIPGGYVQGSEYGYNIPARPLDNADIVKRQTCVWISATISGHVAHWCNNWDGQSVLTFTSWETTSRSSLLPVCGAC